MERVGVRAVVDGAGSYVSDAGRVNAATLGMANAARSAEESYGVFARAQEASASRLRQTGAQMRETGTQAIFLGAALAAPGALAIKFAVDFESAFAGVRKTVDATEAQFGELREGILDLTSTLPTSASGLSDIAAAAGQLGVARQDILEFTRVTAQLAETTDLTTEAAATGLARFANILQLPQESIGRTASALVDLGNKSAATESEILDISTRLAAAGKTIGLSAEEVLAFGTALRSVGVESEAGGTAFSRTFIEIAKAVEGGGTNLERFAEVAGVSGEEFRRAFQQDAAAAVVSFVEGLGRIQESGQGTFGVLEELSLNDARLTRALLSAASAGDLFRDSLATGKTAFAENSALSAEFAKRMETTAAQVRLFLNEVRRLGIEMGTSLLPVVKAAVGAARALVGAFAALPGPVKTAFAVLSLFVGGVVAVAGTLAVFGGTIISIVGSLAVLGGGFGSVSLGLGVLTGALGTATGALGALTAASAAFIISPLGLTFLAIAAAIAAMTIAVKAFGGEANPALKSAEAEGKRLSEETRTVREETEKLLAAEKERRRLAKEGITGPLESAQRQRGRDLLGQFREEVPQGATGAGAREAENEFVFGLSREDAALFEVARREEELTLARRERLRATLETAEGSQAAFTAEQDALAAARDANDQHTQSVNAGRSALGGVAGAFENYIRLIQSGTATTGQLAQAQRDLEAAEKAAAGGADGAAKAVKTASQVFAENYAVTKLNVDAVNELAAAFDNLSRKQVAPTAREEFEKLFPAEAEAEAEGAGRGALPERITGAAAVRRLQQESQVRVAKNEEAQRRAAQLSSLAGRGGTSILDRQKAAVESTEQRQREEQAAALIRERIGLKPGEKGLADVQAQQARLDAAFSGIVDELTVLGFEVPEEFREMFDRIQTESEEGAKRSGTKIGGLLGFLIARRFNQGLDPTAGLISQPASVTASLTRGTPRESGVNIENVNIGPGTTTGDIQQGIGVAFRSAFGAT